MVVDEATMAHRRFFLVVDRLLRDIMGSVDRALDDVPFGGKTVLLSGIHACICCIFFGVNLSVSFCLQLN